MKTSDLLNTKYNEDPQMFQNVLRKIKPFKSIEEDIPFEKLEKYIGLVERKYAIMINYICPTFIPGEVNMWSASINHTNTGEIKEYVFGASIYELFAKICILYYSEIKKGLPLKNWNKAVKWGKT